MLELIVVAWVAIDVLILATVWYGVTTVKPLFPEWWRRHIADEEPKEWRQL